MRKSGAGELFDRAEANGIKLTSPRKEVLRVVAEIDGPFSATQLLEAVEAQAPHVGRATVFRTLQLLCDAKLLERVRLGDGQDVYVAGHASHHHHHLICSSCGEIQAIEECAVDELVRTVAKRQGFLAQAHTFEIYGLCPGCRAPRGD